MKASYTKQLSNPEFWNRLREDTTLQVNFALEVSSHIKEISYFLPTSRETEALPFLEVLGSQLSLLTQGDAYLAFYDTICSNDALIKLFFESLFLGTVEAIFRGKLYNEKMIVHKADIIFCKLTEISTKLLANHAKGEHFCVINLICQICSEKKEYYRSTGKETISGYPFGEKLVCSAEKSHWVQEVLAEGMLIDCVRHNQGKRIWTKGIFLNGKNSSFCSVRYLSDGIESYLADKNQDLALLNSRAKDFQWRSSIKAGDYVDVFAKQWMLAKVIGVLSKKVFIKYRKDEHKSGALFGNVNTTAVAENQQENKNPQTMKYEDNETGFWVIRKSETLKDVAEVEINPHTSLVAQPARYSQRSSKIDDSEDQFYSPLDPSKVTIMRAINNFQSSSTLLIKYMNIFATSGGLKRLFSFLNETNPNQEILLLYSTIIKSITDFLVEGVIKSHGNLLLKRLIGYALTCTEQNLRETTQDQLQTLIDAIEGLALRIMSKHQSRRVLNLIMLKVFFICFQSGILDKQIYSIKIFSRIERNIIIRDNSYFTDIYTYDAVDVEKDAEIEAKIKHEKAYLEVTNEIFKSNKNLENDLIVICNMKLGPENMQNDLDKSILALLLEKNEILSMIIKGHGTLIQKSTVIVKLLFSCDKIPKGGIEKLWNMVIKAEVDTRTNLLKLLQECTNQMNKKSVNHFLTLIVQEISENALPMDLLEFVLELRNSSVDYESKEIMKTVNDILWTVINQRDVQKDIFEKALMYLIRFTVDDEDQDITKRLFEKAQKNLKLNENVLISIEVLSKILEETSMDIFYVREILENQIPNKIIEYISQIKQVLDEGESFNAFGIYLEDKNNDYYLILKKSLGFLVNVIKEEMITDEVMKNLIFKVWKMFFNSQKNIIRENSIINDFVFNLIRKRISELNSSTLSDFLYENIPDLENCEWDAYYDLIKDIFYFLNEKRGFLEKDEVILETYYYNEFNPKRLEFYVLKVPTEELAFYLELEALYFETKNSHLEAFLIQFLGKLISKPKFALSECNELYQQEQNKLIQKSISLIKQNESENIFTDELLVNIQIPNKASSPFYKISKQFTKRLKSIMLLNFCLGMNEPNGSETLVSMASLKENHLITVYVIKESKTSYKVTSKQIINQSITLYEFKLKLSQHYGVRVECIGLRKKADYSTMDYFLNNQTMGQLKIENNEVFEYYEVEMPEVAEEKLLTYKAREVFEEIFASLSVEGFMSPKEIVQFICKATEFSTCSESDDRVTNFLKKYDYNADGLIEQDGFLQFYLDSSITKISTVRENLKSFGYGKDLKLKSDVKLSAEIKYNQTTRYKILEEGGEFLSYLLKDLEIYSTYLMSLVKSLKANKDSIDRFTEIFCEAKYMIKWSLSLQNFIYTMPPSLEIIENLLFNNNCNYINLDSSKEVGYYELIILNGILFNQDPFINILKIISKARTSSNFTSNENMLEEGTHTKRKDPWDDSLVSQPSIEVTGDLGCEFNRKTEGNLLERIKTCLNLNKSLKDLFNEFSKTFFEEKFFTFIENNLGLEFDLVGKQKIKEVVCKIIERGFLALRCHNDMETAKKLSGLNFYMRLKRLYQKKKTDKGSQTGEDPSDPRDEEKIEKMKQKILQSNPFRDTISDHNLDEFSKIIDWEKFAVEEAKSQKISIINAIIKEVTIVLDMEVGVWGGQKYYIKSCLVILLCFLTPLKENNSEIGVSKDLVCKEEIINELIFSKESHFKDFIVKGLMNSSIPTVKFLFRNFYSYILDHLTNIKHKGEFLKLLIQFILTSEDEDVHLLIDLAEKCFNQISELKKNKKSSEEDIDIDFKELFWMFFNKFQKHESKETHFDDVTDFTLVSSISFMEKILKTEPEILSNMTDEEKKLLVLTLLQDCLFNVTPTKILYSGLKCKSNKSRDAALGLLVRLAADDPRRIILIFIKGLSALADHIPVPQSSVKSYSALLENDKKSPLGYLGIKNLGCICYMIAMLQQFFCTETFTRGILMANDYVPEEVSEVRGTEVDDNVFHQMQIMFGYLQDSHRRYFNPLNFCLSYKDYDGQPVNLGVQQDSQEFLNRIFDKLESSLKKTPFKGILDSVYGGYKVNLIECKGCGYIRTNEELFYNLSLEIKGLSTVKQSFKKLTEPETISDFLCDNCKQKCDISKKSCLKTLPNVLILHLQKMIFDLDFMANIKIGTRYQFEKTMNLKDYMYVEKAGPSTAKDSQEEVGGTSPEKMEEAVDSKSVAEEEDNEKDFEYKLVGVVIHKGTAEWGHYVSLIDANRGQDEEKWLLLDDGNVSEFKMENFEEECFGGDIKEENTNIYEFTDSFGGASKSAYILVYDKVVKSKLHFQFNEENLKEKDLIINNLIKKDDYTFKDNILETNFYNLGKYSPPHIKNEIDSDNNKFILEQQLFNSSFLSAMADLFTNSSLPNVNVNHLEYYYDIKPDQYEILKKLTNSNGETPYLPKLSKDQSTLINIFSKVIPKYFFGLFCKSQETNKIFPIQKLLKKIFILDPSKALEFFRNFVENNIQEIMTLLINSTENIIKRAIADILSCCLQVVMKCYHVDLAVPEEQMTPIELSLKTFFVKTLHIYTSIEKANAYKKLAEFFDFLYKCLHKNYRLMDFMIQDQHVNNFYIFYMRKEDAKGYGRDSHAKALNSVLGILWLLISRIKTKFVNLPENKIYFMKVYEDFLSSAFYKKIMKEDYFAHSFEFLQKLVHLGCKNNELITLKLIALSLEGLHMSLTNDILPYLESLKEMIMIKDRFAVSRIMYVFGVYRLDEFRVKGDTELLYLFGLGKEKNLKKSVYNYYSPVLKQRSLVDIMIIKKCNFKEMTAVISLFVIHMAYYSNHVLRHLLKSKAPNYLSGNCIDWLWKFAKDLDLQGHNSYNVIRQEIKFYYLQSFKNKVYEFVAKVRIRLGIGNNAQFIIFEDDHEIDCSRYQLDNSQGSNTEDQSPTFEILPKTLKKFKKDFDDHLEFVSQFKAECIQLKANVLESEKKANDSTDAIEDETNCTDADQSSKERNIVDPDDKSVNDPDSDYLWNNDDALVSSTQTHQKYPSKIATSKNLLQRKLDNCNSLFVQFESNPQMIGRTLGNKVIKTVPLVSEKGEKINEHYETIEVTKNLSVVFSEVTVLSLRNLPTEDRLNLEIPPNFIHYDHYLKLEGNLTDHPFAHFAKPKLELEDDVLSENDKPSMEAIFDHIKPNYSAGKVVPDFSGHNNDYQVKFDGVTADINSLKEIGEHGEITDVTHLIESGCQNIPKKTEISNLQINTDFECNNNKRPDTKKHPKTPALDLKAKQSDCVPQTNKIIRIGVQNKTDSNYFVKLEFNKIEDIDYTSKIIRKGYYETNNPNEVIWSDDDIYTEDETSGEEKYLEAVQENHTSTGSKLFRKNKDLKKVTSLLEKNYWAFDVIQCISNRKKDVPLTYLEKTIKNEKFGNMVIKVSWIKVDKMGIKGLEKYFNEKWHWKLVKVCLPN